MAAIILRRCGAAVAGTMVLAGSVTAAPGATRVVSTTDSEPAYLPLAVGDVVLWSSVRDGVPHVWEATRGGDGWSVPRSIGAAGDVAVTADSGGGRTLAIIGSVSGAPRLMERTAGGLWDVVATLGSAPLARYVALDVSARGEAVVASVRRVGRSHVRVVVSTSRAAGEWTAAHALGARLPLYEGWTGPQVAVDDAGRATVVWGRTGRVVAAAGVVNGRWAGPRPYGHGVPSVAAAGSRTVVTWVEGLHTVMAAGRGAWGLTPPRAAVRVGAGTAIGETIPAVAADGAAVVAYTPQIGASGPARRYRTRVAAVRGARTGEWGRPTFLSAPLPVTAHPLAPTVAAASASDVLVAWRAGTALRAARTGPDRAWNTPVTLGDAGDDTRAVTATGAAGTWLAWSDSGHAVRVSESGP